MPLPSPGEERASAHLLPGKLRDTHGAEPQLQSSSLLNPKSADTEQAQQRSAELVPPPTDVRAKQRLSRVAEICTAVYDTDMADQYAHCVSTADHPRPFFV